MISTPIDIFFILQNWTPVSSSIAATITGAQTVQGGAGVEGEGFIGLVAAVVGPGAGGSNPSPVPVGADLKTGTVGIAYSETITAQGGTAPYTFSVTAGSLPGGTSLNASTGAISGTPSAAATYSFTIGVTDANALTGSQSFTIEIEAPASGGATNYGFFA